MCATVQRILQFFCALLQINDVQRQNAIHILKLNGKQIYSENKWKSF